jgi:PAS domain S-box-containing protein
MSFVIGGMAAGAMAGLSSWFPALALGTLAMLGPFGAGFFLGMESPQPAVGGLILCYMAALLYFGRNVSLSLARSVSLQIENRALIDDLDAARAASDQMVVTRTMELEDTNRALEERVHEHSLTQRALEQSERQLRSITDNLPVMISYIGRDLRYRFVNKLYETWLGQPHASFTGKTVAEAIGEDAYRHMKPQVERVFSGESVAFDAVRNFTTGQREVRIALVPHWTDDQVVDGFFALLQDVTDAKANEQAIKESEERLRSVIQNMPVMMLATEESGNIIVWNRECERITGYSADQIVGNPSGLDLLFPESDHRSRMKDALLVHSDYRDWELDLSCSDGTAKTISWFNISSRYPVPGWASWEMGFDVSERNRSRVELEDALEREKELGELKSRFVAMASHEFRTPLTTIQAAVDLMLRYSDRIDEEQKQAHLMEISREVSNITGLLNDALTLSRDEAGKLSFHPQPTNLRALCADLLEKAKLDALPAHQIAYHCEGGCASVSVDEQLVRHIVTNLLSNALKYSPQGGKVGLHLRCGTDVVTISVEDQGIGIPDGGRKRIFEAFHRFENVGAISGTGLGLAILKRSVDRHGGTVDFESKEGEGTKFTVTLPVAVSPIPYTPDD